MKHLSLVALFLFVFTLNGLGQFAEKSIKVGNIGFNITNAGTIGRPNVRNDPQGNPSMEYPINSGIEHLFEAGLWIGAQVGGQIAVSTGSLDDASGYATGKAGFEFSPRIGSPTLEKSSLTSNANFSTSAIAHQQLELNFTDEYTIVPNTTQPIVDHLIPLKANIKLETYAWNYSFADFFVILNYEITNNSNTNWDSVYCGIWSDLVVRNVNVTTDRGAAFFSKGAMGYVDSLQTIYAYDVAGEPLFTQSYGSIQFLGAEWRGKYFHPNNRNTFIQQGLPAPKVFPQYWSYNVGAPTADLQRYNRMKTQATFDASLYGGSNRVQLLSAGPFVQIAASEKINLVFAFLCAKQRPDNSNPQTKDTPNARKELLEHLSISKRTYVGEDLNENGTLEPNEDLNDNNRLDRYILPEPPATPTTKIVAESNKVTIYWDQKAELSRDPISKKIDFEGYRVYKSNIGDDLGTDLLKSAKLIQQWDKPNNTIGFNNGLAPIKLAQPKRFEGDTTQYYYQYEINDLSNGWQYLFIVTAFDEGDTQLNLESLESSFIENSRRVFAGTRANEFTGSTDDPKVGVYPNPYRTEAAWDGSTSRSKKIMFYNLPARAEIKIYTAAGDVIANLNHNASTLNNGSNSGWYRQTGATQNTILPEGEFAWDILSNDKQTLTSGLYLFSVKDAKTGNIQTGKFVIIK